MNNIFVKIWVHHTEVEPMIDFLLDRVENAPQYCINHIDIPESITGGWVELSIDSNRYLKLRQSLDQLDFLSDI